VLADALSKLADTSVDDLNRSVRLLWSVIAALRIGRSQ